MPHKVIVFGGTGKVGWETVQAALAKGHQVSAFGRSALELPERERLARLVGDIRRPEQVEKAMDGHSVVICTFGAPLTAKTVLSGSDLCETGTRYILQSMRRHNADRLICQTSIGVGSSHGHGRWLFRNLIRPILLDRLLKDRAKQEELVRASEMDWTIVRPAELTDDGTDGEFVAHSELTGVTAYPVDRSDVGRFLADQIDGDAYSGRIVLIAGKGS